MLVDEAVDLYTLYLKDNTRPNTIRSFKFTLSRFNTVFTGQKLADISEASVIQFILSITANAAASTKAGRIGALRAFYNFIIDVTDADFVNPCLRPMVKKLFKVPRYSSPKLLDKELIDEIIFRTTNTRDRLILELMGRAGMRIGEVLGIRASDIDTDNSTVLVDQPKSGRAGEKIYLTKKLCSRLIAYATSLNKTLADRVFDISYSTAHRLVKRSGMIVNSFLRPHDLRRHAATQASRNNIPLEIVSKVILRHADISTTQRYLGVIDPNEASRWVEHLNR